MKKKINFKSNSDWMKKYIAGTGEMQSLIAVKMREEFRIHGAKLDVIISNALGKDEIYMVDIKRLSCRVMPNGNKVFVFDDKPFLELLPLELSHTDSTMTLTQEYRRLNV